MFQVFKIATVAVFVQTAEAHVRAIATGIGCRNCNGNASPGPYSVSGPLSGNSAFGNNGINKVTVGQEVELAIGYNGGHRSNTVNFFNVRYACGAAKNSQNTFRKIGPTAKDQINCAAPCTQMTASQITSVDGQPANANNYPVDATQSSRNGYKVKFKIPAVQGTGDARRCTFALVEGRDWGAGWDFEIAAEGAATPVTTTTKPVAKSLSGTYTFSNANCQKDAPNCQCLEGDIQVSHAVGAKTASALVRIKSFPPQIIQMEEKIAGALAVQYLLSNCVTGQADQLLDINLSPIGTNQASLNVGVVDDVPKMCGSIVKAATAATTLASPGAIQQCPGCQDVAGWKDKDGYTCSQYSSCKNGNWRVKDVKYYQQFAQNGQTALDGCCACGGGVAGGNSGGGGVVTNPPGGGGVVTNPPGGGGVVTNPPGGGGVVTNPPGAVDPDATIVPEGPTTAFAGGDSFAVSAGAQQAVGVACAVALTTLASVFV